MPNPDKTIEAQGGPGGAAPAKIVNRAERDRFEAVAEGGKGELVYRIQGEVMTIVHTEVDPSLEGRGVAGQLVQAALGHARENGLRVDPQCSYARAYMERHPPSP
jgi:predicted GNAT family acetyltransferase